MYTGLVLCPLVAVSEEQSTNQSLVGQSKNICHVTFIKKIAIEMVTIVDGIGAGVKLLYVDLKKY